MPLIRNGVLSPLAGLTSGAGEKLGVAKAVLYGVPKTGTEWGAGALLLAITLTLGTDENLSECVVRSSTYSRSSIRATILNARLSKTLE